MMPWIRCEGGGALNRTLRTAVFESVPHAWFRWCILGESNKEPEEAESDEDHDIE